MITHDDLVQGSPEWHAHRATHFNASDAPAMMGVSPYKTRTQLLHELHTGLTQDVDAATQRRFDDGHRFEALARPVAEGFIGMELYPVTGSEGKLSASFDGLTMCETIGFEHKTLNSELLSIMPTGDIQTPTATTADLPAQYCIQMEQQLMVSGAGRILFMASKWDGDDLVEERHCWYESDAKLRSDILQGWTQFSIDLASYVPAEVVAEVVGRTPETLPALTIIMKGEVSASNLEEFKLVALTAIRSVNRDLKTDQDFADSAKARKWCEDIETRVAAAKDHALGQTKTIDDLFRTMDEISAEARDVRLALEKLEKARKESRRGEIVAGGIKALAGHIAALNTRLGKLYMPATACDFGGAIKGLRTFDSMQNAVDTALANAKIGTSATADKIDANLRHLSDVNAPMALFSDLATICLKANDDFVILVKSRIDGEAARIEAQAEAARERIAEQERIKAEAAATAKAEAQRKEEWLAGAQQRENERQAEIAGAVLMARAEAEKKAQDAITAAQATPVPAPVPAQPMQPIVDTVIPFPTTISATPASTATIRLGQIGEWLGFNLTAEFLRNLGFEPVGRERTAVLYHEDSFRFICDALVKHINDVCQVAA